jgi:hypothetical protein
MVQQAHDYATKHGITVETATIHALARIQDHLNKLELGRPDDFDDLDTNIPF